MFVSASDLREGSAVLLGTWNNHLCTLRRCNPMTSPSARFKSGRRCDLLHLLVMADSARTFFVKIKRTDMAMFI